MLAMRGMRSKSDSKQVEQKGHDAAGDHAPYDAGDHRPSGGIADRRGAAAALKAAQASGNRNYHPVDGSLEHPSKQVGERGRVPGLAKEGGGCQLKHRNSDERP